MRFINGVYTAELGETVSNQELGVRCREAVQELDLAADERQQLQERIDYFLVGERTRQTNPGWRSMRTFAERAAAFEQGAAAALDKLAEQIVPAARRAGVVFDAVFTTTSTGSLMPGLSYRLSHLLGDAVRPDSMQIDLAHVGCTGGLKLLNLVRQLRDEVSQCLLVSVELPTTLINLQSRDVDVWQGNCTFGDGAAALWVSQQADVGPMALQVEQLNYFQHADAGLDLIRWGYSDYYTFRLADEATFNQDVRRFITHSMSSLDKEHLDSPRWAIHPAGVALLMRLSRKLGLNRKALKPAVKHYTRYSNMSSAGVLHILRDIAEAAEVGEDINLLTMGAGFNVIYGRVRRER